MHNMHGDLVEVEIAQGQEGLAGGEQYASELVVPPLPNSVLHMVPQGPAMVLLAVPFYCIGSWSLSCLLAQVTTVH